MSVSYDRIIQKLSEQIEQAERAKENPTLLKRHISQIHVLCELILEENKDDFLMKDQLTSSQLAGQSSTVSSSTPTREKIVKTELTDDSIFDF